MKKTIAILSLAFLAGCSSLSEKSSRIDVDTHLKSKPLTSKKYDIGPDVMLNSVAMVVTGPYLVVKNWQKEPIFDVFDASSLRHLYSDGSNGHALTDFLVDTDRQYLEPTATGIQTFAVASHILQRATVTDSCITVKPTESVEYNTNAASANGFVYVADTLAYVLSNPGDSYEYDKIGVGSPNAKRIGTYPEFAQTQNDFDKFFSFAKRTVANPQKDRLASFYIYYPYFKLLDFDGNQIKGVYTSGDSELDADKNLYWKGIWSDDNRIVALYETRSNGGKSGSSVIVFDWDGNVISKYTLDEPLGTFTVKGNKIYGLNNEDTAICVYEMTD